MKVTPNFLIIGAQKAGTTTLDGWLGQHPALFIPVRKELNYFALDGKCPRWTGPGDGVANRQSVWRVEEYEKFFEPAPPEAILGESSVLYLYSESAAAAIRKNIPDAKILVTLRPPVARAYSAFCHLRRDGRELEVDFASAMNLEKERIASGFESLWHYGSVGFYGRQLARYFDLFNRNQIKILWMDELKQRPEEIFREICQFLEIDPEISIDFKTVLNVSGKPQNQFVNDFLNGPNLLKSVVKNVVPLNWGRRWKAAIQRRNLKRFPPLANSVRREMESIYREDQTLLCQLLR